MLSANLLSNFLLSFRVCGYYTFKKPFLRLKHLGRVTFGILRMVIAITIFVFCHR